MDVCVLCCAGGQMLADAAHSPEGAESHPCWIRTHWSASSSPQLFLPLPFIQVQLVLCEISVLMSCLSVCRWVSFLVPLKTKMFPWGKQSFRISILVLHLIIFPNSSVLSLFPSKKRCVVRLQEPEGFSWVYGGHCNVFCWTSQWESATLACQDPVSRLKCPLVTRGAL